MKPPYPAPSGQYFPFRCFRHTPAGFARRAAPAMPKHLIPFGAALADRPKPPCQNRLCRSPCCPAQGGCAQKRHARQPPAQPPPPTRPAPAPHGARRAHGARNARPRHGPDCGHGPALSVRCPAETPAFPRAIAARAHTGVQDPAWPWCGIPPLPPSAGGRPMPGAPYTK